MRTHVLRSFLLRFRVLWRRAVVGGGALGTVAAAWLRPHRHSLVMSMWRFTTSLPWRYDGVPLPDFLAGITPAAVDLEAYSPAEVRSLVDAVARLDRRSPFGLCLRRSLLRYHFVGRTGLTLGITFGVRMRQEHEGEGVAGHAWNTLEGLPWCEREEDYRGFTVIYVYPETSASQPAAATPSPK